MLDGSSCPAVERDSRRVSGGWVFRGTRAPVSALFENLEDGVESNLSQPQPDPTQKPARPTPRPGRGERMEIWLIQYPNADLWSFRASLYKEGGWLFKYPDLNGQSTYGFRTYEEAAREVEAAGYQPVKSDRIEIVTLD